MIRNEQERLRMGERIATLRKSIDWTDANGIHRHGMTQAELAERAGLQRPHIVRIEQGKYGITIDVLSTIAKALNCEIDFIPKQQEL